MTFSTTTTASHCPRLASGSAAPQPAPLPSHSRPFPGACRQERSLLAAVEELTEVVRVLSRALGGEDALVPPALRPQSLAPDRLAPEPLAPEAPAPEPLPPEQPDTRPFPQDLSTAQLLDLLDSPWFDLSVVELRRLLRDLPIDRSSLPAPIEYLRRHELLSALQTLPPTSW